MALPRINGRATVIRRIPSTRDRGRLWTCKSHSAGLHRIRSVSESHGVQSRLWSLPLRRPHSHHSHHHHDTTYLVSSNTKDAGVRITRIGLYANLGMAVAKGCGGYIFNSQSMIADAWHSLTDLASDVLTLATVSWSLKPPTASFPLGFGKVESLGSLGVSGMLMLGGCFMCWNSCEALYAHFLLDADAAQQMAASIHGHGHGHGHGYGHGVGPSLHAVWLAAGTIVVKEWLYHKTMQVAKERKSSVLASNAIHHRVDSMTGVVTLLAILGANILHNAAWLDPVGGLLISLLVIKAGFGNTLSALYELADRGIDEEMKETVRQAVQTSLGSLSTGHEVELLEVEGNKCGQNYLVELLLRVPSTWTVEETISIEDGVRKMVGEHIRGIKRVKIRFVPHSNASPTLFDEFIDGQRATGRHSHDTTTHTKRL